jgi:hypothetical protein
MSRISTARAMAEDERDRRDTARVVHQILPNALRKAAHTGIAQNYRYMADGRVGVFSRSNELVGYVADVAEAMLMIRRGDEQRIRLEHDERRFRRSGGPIETIRSSGDDSTDDVSVALSEALRPYRGEIAKLTPEQRQKLLTKLTAEAKVLAAMHERNRIATRVNGQAERARLKLEYANQPGTRSIDTMRSASVAEWSSATLSTSADSKLRALIATGCVEGRRPDLANKIRKGDGRELTFDDEANIRAALGTAQQHGTTPGSVAVKIATELLGGAL